jgi:hypothetical protein
MVCPAGLLHLRIFTPLQRRCSVVLQPAFAGLIPMGASARVGCGPRQDDMTRLPLTDELGSLARGPVRGGWFADLRVRAVRRSSPALPSKTMAHSGHSPSARSRADDPKKTPPRAITNLIAYRSPWRRSGAQLCAAVEEECAEAHGYGRSSTAFVLARRG